MTDTTPTLTNMIQAQEQDDGGWVEGVFETERAAREAVGLPPLPKRIRRRSGAGLPDGALDVAHGSPWGNPFLPSHARAGLTNALIWNNEPTSAQVAFRKADLTYPGFNPALDRIVATALMGMFRLYAETFRHRAPDEYEAWIAPLRGREFAVISAGCAAILTGRYIGTWPHGHIQVLDTGLHHTECWWKTLDALTPEETEAMERGMEFNRKSIEGHPKRCAAMAAAEEATNDDA